jgi:nucleoside-diphosphate-sugar epimerase
MSFWNNKATMVTGGASFIGARLVDKLVEAGARVRVADNLSSGKLENIEHHIQSGDVEFMQGDLRESPFCAQAVADQEMLFHLAADHGGRGYVDLHQAGPASNLLLDGLVFYEALKAGVEKVVYASSGCVYPNSIQMDPQETLYLTENLVRPPYDADNMYGWAKLMAEDTLRAYHKEHGLKSANCRYFTVYGPHGLENHAVIAMIARAFVRQDPFEVWGDGSQIRNWTHVDDIVSGTMLAAEFIDDGTGVNIGTMERTRVIDAAREVIRYAGYEADIRLLPEMPTGPLNRVADNTLARELMGWEPKISFMDGLHQTMDWYFGSRTKEDAQRALETELTER